MKIGWDGQEKSHQNIFKNQKFQSVWNLKLLFPTYVFLLKESLLFQDVEHDRQHQLCPEKVFPQTLSTSIIYKPKMS